jgi:hypothetical protein
MLLLSLIGEQPIPNLLPLWQFPEYSATQFAATRTTLPMAHTLAAAVRRDAQLKKVDVLEPLLLEAYDIAQARDVLTAALVTHRAQGREVCLNLTGGTKLMSLAALQAAFGSGIRLLYISSEQNQVIMLASDGSERARQPIQVRISAEQYLAAHGLEVEPAGRRPSELKDGSWLEEIVARRALESGSFDDVRRNVFIRKHSERGLVENELDVVVTRNGRLAVCSCKSGRKITKEQLYELTSLSRREAAGIYCGKVLVTDLAELSQALRERARSMGVHLVYGKELERVAEHLLAATR